jgi:hypothetical protein
MILPVATARTIGMVISTGNCSDRKRQEPDAGMA